MGYDKELYHFTTLENALKILLSEEFITSSFCNADDPKEYDMANLLNELLQFGATSIEDFIYNNYRYISFSSHIVDKKTSYNGVDRPRMWAQYADNFKGVCVVFDRDKIKKMCKQKNAWIYKISYKKVVSFGNGSYIKLEDYKDKYNFIDTIKSKLFFTKTDDWASEDEVRIVFNSVDSIPIKGLIKRIVFGLHINKNLSKGIKKMFSEIKLSSIELSKGRLNEIDDLDPKSIFYEEIFEKSSKMFRKISEQKS